MEPYKFKFFKISVIRLRDARDDGKIDARSGDGREDCESFLIIDYCFCVITVIVSCYYYCFRIIVITLRPRIDSSPKQSFIIKWCDRNVPDVFTAKSEIKSAFVLAHIFRTN